MKRLNDINRFNVTAMLAFTGVAMLAGAMAFQHLGGLTPCALCIDQRRAWAAVILLATLSAWAEGKSRIAVALLLLTIAALAALAGAGLAGFHVGVEQGWWAGTAACGGNIGGSGASTADLREQLLATPVVRCDDIAWSVLGISMAGWNGLVSLVAGMSGLAVVYRDVRRIRQG
jgi:disulfide bond formation protein DsbB